MQEFKLVTIKDLCTQLRIGRNAAYKLLATGQIKAFKIGKSWKFTQQAINEYIIESCQGTH